MSVRPSIAFLADVGLGPAQIIELAREAEEAEFAGAWMVEYEYDSFALDQAIAMATKRITTGSSIARSFTRHPLLTAESATVIDLVAPGRFIIGLGTGPMKRADPALPQQRWGLPSNRAVARMREYIQVIRLALTGEVVNYQGEFYQVKDVQLRLTPSAAEIPIYLAAGGEQMMCLASQEADGVFVHLVDEVMTDHELKTARQAAKQAGRRADSLKLANLIMTCVSHDGAVARRAMRCYLVDYYLHLPRYQQVLADAGFRDTASDLSAYRPRGDTRRSVDSILADANTRRAVDCIPDKLLDEFTIVGTPDECRSRFETFVAWGTDVPILYAFPAGDDWAAGYRAVIEALGAHSA